MFSTKTKQSLCSSILTTAYKNSFYQKSLPIKTDFSLYRREFKLWHPRYFDVARWSEYQKKKRDYKKLRFNTQDPLHFDYNMKNVNGGFELLLENVKKDKTPGTTYSIYRIIYLIYHMAKNDIYDTEFFDELESQVSPVIANASFLAPRMLYGALYGYYKFARGRPENILFYETALEEDPSVLHSEMTSELFELANTSAIVDKDRLELFITNFFKPNFLNNWDQEVRHKQRLIAEYHRIFMKVNYLDEEVWNKLIDITINAKRINNMNNYHTMLTGLLWYNDNPKSPKFKKIDKEVQKFKDRIRLNPNRMWKYDPEAATWRTYDQLLLNREEIDENFVHTFQMIEHTRAEVKEVIQKKEWTVEETKKLVEDKLKQKVNIIKIRRDLIAEEKIPDQMIEEAIMRITKETQTKSVENLKKKGTFELDMDEKTRMQMRKNMMQPVAPAKPAAGGKKPGDKKK